MFDQRVIVGAAADLRWTKVDGFGEPVAPEADVAVSVALADGSPLIDGAAVVDDDTGDTTFTLPAASNAALQNLVVTWTEDGQAPATTLVDVCGGVYFTVARARRDETALDDDDRYPTAAIQAMRSHVEDDFERICQVAFVPRFARRVVDVGAGLILPTPMVRRVVSVGEVDGADVAPWSVDDVAAVVAADDGLTGALSAPRAVAGRRLMIEWEHGWSRPPGLLPEKGITYLRYLLLAPSAGVPDRATSFAVDQGGTYQLATASKWEVGIPDIDAELGRWSMRTAGIA